MMDDLLKKGLSSLPKKQIAHTVLDFLWDSGERYLEEQKERTRMLRERAMQEAQERQEVKELLKKLAEKYS